MALSLEVDDLNARIDALRTGYSGHNAQIALRNRAYLRAFSPRFETLLGEHDQWPDPFRQRNADYFRSSYNVSRPVVDIWASLEMSDFPNIRWGEGYRPLPAPTPDEAEQQARTQAYRAQQLFARTRATMREQGLMRHVTRAKLHKHSYAAVRRKNVYGHSWLKTVPDRGAQSFRVFTNIDPSTVYPVWSAFDDDRLEAILVATRRSAQSVNDQYPGTIKLSRDGLTMDQGADYYQPTANEMTDIDRTFVWVEDYWVVDSTWEAEPQDSEDPITSRVVNAIRVNGKVVERIQYPGWKKVPYVRWENPNERDQFGFSDVATMLPIQDSINRFLSQQQDVIAGESRPRFKYRGDAQRVITMGPDEVVSLDPDEDIEQIQIRLDVFPTQVHGQQIMEIMSRATGLPDTVWGRITAAQNSGRALATAWRSVAARMVPRTLANDASLTNVLSMWCDWIELYNWGEQRSLYGGNRDFTLDFPNQEPRDFTEVSTDAINRLNAGLIDSKKAMELTGEQSPDEMDDRVRAEYMDPVRHPEKSQAMILLTKLQNEVVIEAQQAGLAAQAQQAQLEQMRLAAPGGAPGVGNTTQQQGRADQARRAAAQQAAPTQGPGQNQPGPATQVNSTGNATKVSTLVQDGGDAQNRIIDQSQI